MTPRKFIKVPRALIFVATILGPGTILGLGTILGPGLISSSASAQPAAPQFAATPSMSPIPAQATPAPGEAWKSSPFHGRRNEATGLPIPCRCKFSGQEFRLGQRVCMTTHLGVRVAVCDLNQNITTWAPTDEMCVIS